MFKFRSISARIAVSAGFLVFVLCVGLGVVSYSNGARAVRAQVEEALQLQAKQASEYLETRIGLHMSVLETIAALPQMASMDWEEQLEILSREMATSNSFLALGVADPSGVARYTDGSSGNIASRAHFQKAMAGQSAVSDVMTSIIDNSIVLIYAAPIRQGNKVVGVLIGRRDGGVLREITDDLGFGQSGRAYIIGQNGTLFAHPDLELVLNQENIFNESSDYYPAGKAIQEIGIGKAGVFSYTLASGETRIAAIAPVESTGWSIIVGAAEKEVMARINSMRSTLIIVSAVFVFVGIGSSVLIGKQVANPIRRVQEVMEAVAAGDLTSSVTIKSQDELGSLANSVNTTIETMRKAMGLIIDSAQGLNNISTQMAASVEEMSASIEEVASTTNEFSSAVDHTNSNAQGVNAAMGKVSRRAEDGQRDLEEILESVRKLGDAARDAAQNIGRLGTLSDEVGGIVTTVGAIADQTKLLALNAAIEAARAGEHGRSFAVVADEVRKLAEESGKAAEEISALITQIQADVAVTVAGSQAAVGQADEAVTMVDASAGTLKGILKQVEDIAAQVQNISEGLMQINRGGQEIASAAEEQAASMQELATSAGTLKSISDELVTLVKGFKLSK